MLPHIIMDKHTFISTTLDRYGHLLDVNGDEILKAVEDEILKNSI